jgi:hypothetical protein
MLSLLLVLAQSPVVVQDPSTSQKAKVVSGSLQVTCTSGCSGSSGGTSSVNILDAGVLNVNPITVQGGIINVQIVDAGAPINVQGPLTDTQLRAAPVPISASALPLPSGAAQDSTLTGGTAKAITRGGAKGATTAADVTSTAEGADHQAVDVQIMSGGVAKDPTQIRALTSADQVTIVPSGTQAVTGPLTDAQLRASAVPVSAAQSGTWTDRIVGNAGGVLDSANNAAAPANVIATGIETVAAGSTPTAATGGNMRRPTGTTAGSIFVERPGRWTCNLQALAASLTQCQAAPAAGFSLIVTSIIATTTTATAGTFALRSGTGSNCATGTLGVWPQPGGSTPSRVTTAPISTAPPMVIAPPDGIKLPAASALCVIGTATNTIDITISGETAP